MSTDPTIWKFDLLPGAAIYKMPAGARLLSVAVQAGPVNDLRAQEGWQGAGGVPRLWAMVLPGWPTVSRRIVVVGTGEPLPLNALDAVYVGSFMLLGGAFVGHVLDCGEVA